MRLLYALPLVLWLAFSSNAAAVTFTFEVMGGDVGLVDFAATIVLNDPEPIEITATTSDSAPPVINLGSAIDSFFLSYKFFTGGQIISTDSLDLFSNPRNIHDLVFFFNPSNGTGDLFHNVSDAGFGAFGSSDSTGLWEIVFSSDFNFLDPPILTGRFVQVPEPGQLALVLMGLAMIGLRALRRSA